MWSRRAIALVVALLAGCAGSSPYMEDGTAPEEPEPGKALVYFLRPSGVSWSTDFEVWDGDRFLGHALARSCFAGSLAPGRHLFLALAENVSAVEARLESGGTYYILASVAAEAGGARVDLHPITRDSEHWDRAALWAKDLAFTVPRPAAVEALTAAKREEVRGIIARLETVEGRADVRHLPADAGR